MTRESRETENQGSHALIWEFCWWFEALRGEFRVVSSYKYLKVVLSKCTYHWSADNKSVISWLLCCCCCSVLPRLVWSCLLLQFLGILAAVLVLQVAAGVVGYLFTDVVTMSCSYWTETRREIPAVDFLRWVVIYVCSGDGEDGQADDEGHCPIQRGPGPGERHRLHPEEGEGWFSNWGHDWRLC